ncbi:hypothetical protein AB0D90_03575 [Streptomyces althioticus]|uniref:hypothetical protein n=1 Tax=Streptomyces althioticus TaxID=83380 RepID=UPI0033E54330
MLRLRTAYAIFEAAAAVGHLDDHLRIENPRRLAWHFEAGPGGPDQPSVDSLVGTGTTRYPGLGDVRFQLLLAPGPGDWDVTARLTVTDAHTTGHVLHDEHLTVSTPDDGTLLHTHGFGRYVAAVVEAAVTSHLTPAPAVQVH